jgi:hypothetical protein
LCERRSLPSGGANLVRITILAVFFSHPVRFIPAGRLECSAAITLIHEGKRY